MFGRKWRALVAVAILGILSAVTGAPSTPVATAASVRGQETQVVSMVNNRFVSDFLIVTVGGTVQFRNDEGDPSVKHDIYSEDGTLLSPVIAPGESWSFTFGSEGFWHYLCSFHPGMEADILVVAAQ